MMLKAYKTIEKILEFIYNFWILFSYNGLIIKLYKDWNT